MTPLENARAVAVIGAGLDLGAGRRGVDMGPSAIRYAGLAARIRALGHDVADHGDVLSPVPEAIPVGSERARYLEPILEACASVAELVARVTGEGGLPLVLGGDHSVAIGTLGGMAAAHGPGGVLWIDAHADLNRPETSPTGNVHGMPLAAALGVGGPQFGTTRYPVPSVTRAAFIGLRAVDPGEKALIRELELPAFTMSDIDRTGLEHVVRQALDHLSGCAFVHVSLDLDSIDPTVAPGVGTPVNGGLSYREAHLLLELVAESHLLDSLEVVEVNPILDRENQTGKLAVELVASALGDRIL